ncbi:MAG: family transcriptional regulator [Rhodoferax sp.]|nr:family transcriptional regulator [Rhodoferax sp.]
MAQGKRISESIDEAALATIQQFGLAARRMRTAAGEGQATAAARLGVHVQTIARIESGEAGVAVGHVVGLLSLYGATVVLQQPQVSKPASVIDG